MTFEEIRQKSPGHRAVYSVTVFFRMGVMILNLCSELYGFLPSSKHVFFPTDSDIFTPETPI